MITAAARLKLKEPFVDWFMKEYPSQYIAIVNGESNKEIELLYDASWLAWFAANKRAIEILQKIHDHVANGSERHRLREAIREIGGVTDLTATQPD